jgi:hypothetical protein
VIVLDLPTMKFCATLARTAAEAVQRKPGGRAHHHCAAGALEGYAEQLEEMMKTGLNAPHEGAPDL